MKKEIGGKHMERVPYRRYRDARQEMQEPDENAGALGETLILQGIISGLILVAVMLVSILTLSFMEPVQATLEQTLTGPTTPAELLHEARQFGIETLGWEWLE